MTRLTLIEAAAASGLSYRQVYRRVVQQSVVSSEREGQSYTIAAADLALLVPRAPAKDPRPGITLRPSVEQARAWKRTAGRRTVSGWLLALANAASGWDG
jgi:hypothetical protein